MIKCTIIFHMHTIYFCHNFGRKTIILNHQYDKLVKKIWQPCLEDISELTNDYSVDADNEETHDEPFSEQPDGDRSGHSKVLPKELEEASNFYDSAMAATTTETNESQILQLIARRLESEKEKMVDDRTAALWLDLVRAYIRSETHYRQRNGAGGSKTHASFKFIPTRTLLLIPCWSLCSAVASQVVALCAANAVVKDLIAP